MINARQLARWAPLAAALLLATCAHPAPETVPPPEPIPEGEPPPPPIRSPEPPIQPPPEPELPLEAAAEPEIGIGLIVGAEKFEFGSEAPLTVLGPSGDPLRGAPQSRDWTVVRDAGALALVTPEGWRSARLSLVTLAPTGPAMAVSLGDRPFRGRIVVTPDRTGLSAINRVGLETYLAGVVSAEMGRRDSTEFEALAAQAIISRTFAIRNLGKRHLEGFDLYATVVDQIYGGVSSETALGWRAVRETTGQILTYQGAPIDAFFFSTCGGRTAEGTEIFAGARRPYLRSIRDEDETGQIYCRISPRFRWREEWTGDQLRAILQRTLPTFAGVPAAAVNEVRDVRVASRSGSDRVTRLVVELPGSDVAVEGSTIRQVLHPATEPLLRSNAFTLSVTRAAGQVVGLVAEGGGAGHGVGFCQWGAVGRARAGLGHQAILAAYFRDTRVERVY